MRNLLIIGGGGLCGQAIAKKHRTEGDCVFIYDEKLNPYNDYSDMFGFDIAGSDLNSIFSRYRFDIVSTQQAFVGVGESQFRISKYMRNNVGSMADALQAMVNNSNFPKLIIHAGSMGGYGEGDIDKTCEDFSMNPKSYYGISKVCQEEMIRVFNQTYKVPAVSLRYFSVYGLNSNPLNPYTGVLSVIANKIINADEVELNEDGEQRRDLICADDVANAHFLASKKIEAFTDFVPINIGAGKSVSLNYVAQRMLMLMGSDKKITHNNRHRIGDIRNMCADTKRARDILGFKSSVDIDEGIERYCQFIIKNRDRFVCEDTTEKASSELEAHHLYE